MLAGVATGAFADLDEASRAMVVPRRRYEPDTALRATYDGAYRRYLDLFEALRPLFATASPAPIGQPDAGQADAGRAIG